MTASLGWFALAEIGPLGAWPVALVAGLVISVAFLAVAATLAINLTRQRQWGANPLGVGTFALYLTCGGGHAVRALQLLEPAVGFQGAIGTAAMLESSDWHIWLWSCVIAAAGVWYWTMRRRFPALVSGAAVFEDLRERRRRALEIHDNVLQGLVRAKLAIDLNARREGDAAIAETLEASKTIITDLLGSMPLQPGELRRPRDERRWP